MEIKNITLKEFIQIATKNIGVKKFEKELVNVVSSNIDFYSYLLIYDEVSEDCSSLIHDDKVYQLAEDTFICEYEDIFGSNKSLPQFVLEKLDLTIDDVVSKDVNKNLFISSLGSYISHVFPQITEEAEIDEIAGFIASMNMNSLQESVSDDLMMDDFILEASNYFLKLNGYDLSDYEGSCYIDGEYLFSDDAGLDFEETDFMALASEIKDDWS